MHNDASTVAGLIFLAIALAVYFLPIIVAARRSHRQAGMVFVINLFLGWTLVGWVVALGLGHARGFPPAGLPWR